MKGEPSELIDLLARLVGVPTVNPGGDEARLCQLLAGELEARGPDHVEVRRVGGHAWVAARWGTPRLLVNAHVDTVPVDAGWKADPFELRREGDELVGIGSADTKGAIAAILTALAGVRPRDTLIVFSGDEELGGSCIRDLIDGGHLGGVERAIVCEPTSCRAGTRHRGVVALELARVGEGGHSSKADHLPAPVAELAAVAAAWHAWGRERRDEGPAGFPGMCMNIARLEGGVAFNVVPRDAKLSASFRPPPGSEIPPLVEELGAMAARLVPDARFASPLANPAFLTRDLAAFKPLLGQVVDEPIDLGFWTEAAVLAAAGVDAVVFGPGDIGVAHRAEEHVPIADLERARDAFLGVFTATHGTG